MPDLVIAVPSRGRPQNIARLLDAVHENSRMETYVHAGIDDDDPERERYEYVFRHAGREGDVLHHSPRMGLAAWTNELVLNRIAPLPPYVASFGDDHLPITKGFDRALIRGIEDMGSTGIVYPWDGTREDIPEAVVMSSNIIQALGWMCEPSLSHFYIDNVWAYLGRGAGCLRHLRAVWVDHVHPSTGQVPADDTYRESTDRLKPDREVYMKWRAERSAADIKKICALRETQA